MDITKLQKQHNPFKQSNYVVSIDRKNSNISCGISLIPLKGCLSDCTVLWEDAFAGLYSHVGVAAVV